MADEEVKAKWGVLQERHRAEIKESRAEVMRLKKSVTQGDKKKKKDITAQIATLESDLADRQAAEERAFKAEHPELFAKPAAAPAPAATEPSTEDGDEEAEDDTSSASSSASQGPRVTRAAKRRTKKAEQAAQVRREAEADAAALPNHRAREDELLAALLAKMQCTVGQIRADGNCLFSAVADQVARLSRKAEVPQSSYRVLAANYMRSHPDDFAPFLVDHAALQGADGLNGYLRELTETPMWGGELEITALAHALQRPIHVYQAESPTVKVGEQYAGAPIMLSYHRHAYSLGEHYNSVVPVVRADDDDDDDSAE